MSKYDDILELGIDNYGIVTSTTAKSIGVSGDLLRDLNRRGKLEKLGYGVYRLEHTVITELDPFAVAVALVGEGSYIWGESVLDMYNLALVNPVAISVATPKQVRKSLPRSIEVVKPSKNADVVIYEGIPTQTLYGAFLDCKSTVMTGRLADAINKARNQGLLTQDEATKLRSKIGNAN